MSSSDYIEMVFHIEDTNTCNIVDLLQLQGYVAKKEFVKRVPNTDFFLDRYANRVLYAKRSSENSKQLEVCSDFYQLGRYGNGDRRAY